MIMNRKFLKYFVFVVIAVLIGACSGSNSEQLKEIEASFQVRKDVVYEEAQTDLKQDHVFEFKISKTAQKVLKERRYPSRKYFSVYTDKELNNEIKFKYDNEDGNISIAPNSKSTIRFEKASEKSAIAHEDGEWGIFDHYFLVQNIDLDTGESLKKPLVTIFTVQQDLATPKVKTEFTEDGIMNLTWDKVSGASEYALIKIDFLGNAKTSAKVIAVQKENTWSSKDIELEFDYIEEELFENFYLSEDMQFLTDTEYWWEDREITDFQGSKLAVVALNDKKTSAMSYETEYEPASLTCQIAETAMEEQKFSHNVKTAQEVPTTIPVTACDGASVNRKVTYEFDNIAKQDDGIHIPYRIDNSTMRNEFVVVNSTLDEVKTEVKKKESIKEKETPVIYANKKMIPAHVRESSTLPKLNDEVFSNSKFETFVAKNMIDGVHKIDVSAFKDARDVEYVYDLLGEIINQNPLILEVLEIEYDTRDKVIYVEYLFDHATRSEKQQAIRSQVPAIVAEIITPEMSDIEKVFAINQYICDKTTYDHDAADAIIESGGYKMDPLKYDANIATGVFTNGLAVCEGYASAFNLLANEAGLDSIVITGNLNADKDIRHAWNRVRIDNQWYVVDTTTNDAEDVENSILILSDEKASLYLTQDDIFLLSDDIENYTASGDDAEYYRQKGLYVSAEEAVDAYVSRLSNSNSVILRLPETLSEGEIEGVADQVFNRMNRSMEYIYLNGVLRIKLE